MMISEITLNKSTLTLNARPATGSVSPGYVVEEQLTATVLASNNAIHSVTWASSNTSLVTVTDGLVSTVVDAPEGTATITATSVDDSTKKATASVTVTRFGDTSLGIE